MRIASLSPAATEVLFALGKGADIVVTDQFSHWPDQAKVLPKLMGHTAVDIKKLREFRPEVILTATVVQQKLKAELEAAGLPVFHQDPRRLSEVFTSWKTLGTSLEVEEDADFLVLECEARLKRVRDRAKLLPRKLRVYIEEWHDPPMASGNWVPDLAAAAGIQVFPLSAGELSRAVSLKEVRRFDPELIIVSWCGAGTLADPILLTSRPGWEVLAAVQKGSVKVIDDSLLNRPGPRLVEGAERLYTYAFEALHGA